MYQAALGEEMVQGGALSLVANGTRPARVKVVTTPFRVKVVTVQKRRS